MRIRQFRSSIKREWLELIRTKKFFAYIVTCSGLFILNLLLSLVHFVTTSAFLGFSFDVGTRYGMISHFNENLVFIFLIVVLLIIRPSVTSEITGKKLVQPFFMGLKPSIHLGSKYIVQILTPAIIAFAFSLFNGMLAIIIYGDPTFTYAVGNIISVDAVRIILSSLSVFICIVFYLALHLSLSALIKKCNIALALTLLFYIFGELLTDMVNVTVFSPNELLSYAVSLTTVATNVQLFFSVVITVSIISLVVIASIMVYDDRNDMSAY